MRLSVVTRPRPDRTGALPLYLRVQHGDTTRYVALGLRVQTRDWNARKGEVRASSPHALQLNRVLAERLSAAQQAATDLAATGRTFTADRLKAAVELVLHPEAIEVPAEDASPASPGLIEYARTVQHDLNQRGQVGTAYVYNTTIAHLEASVRLHFAKDDVPMGEITPPFLRAHEGRLSTPKPTGLGHKPNYAAKQLRTLRAILRRAEADGIPGATDAVLAMRSLRIRTERVEKQRLSVEQVRVVETAALTGRQADARDWWLASFYLGGLRFGDIAALRWDQLTLDPEGRPATVRIRQRKTGDPHVLPVLPQLAAILERWKTRTGPRGVTPSPYVFGLVTEFDLADPHRARTALQRANGLARTMFYRICSRLELPKVGPHAARHSIADHLRRSGTPLATISMILGHSNIATTTAYLRGFDPEGVEAELVRVLGQEA